MKNFIFIIKVAVELLIVTVVIWYMPTLDAVDRDVVIGALVALTYFRTEHR